MKSARLIILRSRLRVRDFGNKRIQFAEVKTSENEQFLKKILKIGISLWQVQSLPCLGITTKLFVITLVAGPVLTVKVQSPESDSFRFLIIRTVNQSSFLFRVVSSITRPYREGVNNRLPFLHSMSSNCRYTVSKVSPSVNQPRL